MNRVKYISIHIYIHIYIYIYILYYIYIQEESIFTFNLMLYPHEAWDITRGLPIEDLPSCTEGIFVAGTAP